MDVVDLFLQKEARVGNTFLPLFRSYVKCRTEICENKRHLLITDEFVKYPSVFSVVDHRCRQTGVWYIDVLRYMRVCGRVCICS